MTVLLQCGGEQDAIVYAAILSLRWCMWHSCNPRPARTTLDRTKSTLHDHPHAQVASTLPSGHAFLAVSGCGTCFLPPVVAARMASCLGILHGREIEVLCNRSLERPVILLILVPSLLIPFTSIYSTPREHHVERSPLRIDRRPDCGLPRRGGERPIL